MEIQPEIIAQMLVSLPRDLAKHIVFAGINNNPSNLLKVILAVCFVANKKQEDFIRLMKSGNSSSSREE